MAELEERIKQLNDGDRDNGWGLLESMETAQRLARGPNPQRGEHWAWTAIERRDDLERFLKAKGV